MEQYTPIALYISVNSGYKTFLAEWLPDSTHHMDFQLQSDPDDAVLHQTLRNKQRVYSILLPCSLIAGLNFLRFFQFHYILILMHNVFHHIFYNNMEVAQYRYLYSRS